MVRNFLVRASTAPCDRANIRGLEGFDMRPDGSRKSRIGGIGKGSRKGGTQEKFCECYGRMEFYERAGVVRS